MTYQERRKLLSLVQEGVAEISFPRSAVPPRHFRPRVCLEDRKWRAPKEDGSGAVPRVGLSHAADPHLSFPRTRGPPSPPSPFISPRESNRAIDATAIIRNRPRRCCLAGNDIRVFHLLLSSFPQFFLFFVSFAYARRMEKNSRFWTSIHVC